MFLLCAILLVSGIRRFFKGKDKVPPVITLDHRENYVVMPWQEYEEEGFSASDDRDGDLTEQVSRTVTEDRICYRVSDSAGNESVVYRDIPYDTSYKEKTGKDFPEINIDDSDAQGKIVYLTFDYGPGPYTEELLETLDRYGVQVTFFVTGAFPAYEDMIKKEDAAGNSVGIHTLTHDFEKIYSDDKAFWKDIDQMQEIVQRQTGHTTNLMRFAGGSSNSISASYTPGIMTLLTEQAQQKGFQYFDWNISSGDGGSEGDMNMVINNITSNLPNQDTCVVLCHDTKEYTVNAMKYLIPWLLDHGYDIRPLQFDSEPAHHGVQN
jgi:peptidoglycan/xylan/chitin deacetylase (PgdA/CDA1 family)